MIEGMSVLHLTYTAAAHARGDGQLARVCQERGIRARENCILVRGMVTDVSVGVQIAGEERKALCRRQPVDPFWYPLGMSGPAEAIQLEILRKRGRPKSRESLTVAGKSHLYGEQFMHDAL